MARRQREMRMRSRSAQFLCDVQSGVVLRRLRSSGCTIYGMPLRAGAKEDLTRDAKLARHVVKPLYGS